HHLIFLSYSSFYSQLFGSLRVLLSFPTRRSSDLAWYSSDFPSWIWEGAEAQYIPGIVLEVSFEQNHLTYHGKASSIETIPGIYRSEEHTSELQSRFDLVCRLLLEKKI